MKRKRWCGKLEHLADTYRQKLMDAGFQEAAQNPWCFYREDMPLTAFFVNLKILSDHICIFYGFASTAFTRLAGCENSLMESGIREDDNCLRFYGEIRTEADAMSLREASAERYRQYHGMDKESLLNLIKARRKAFIGRIDAALKPLGFRKKGNQWRKPLGESIILQFWADKSTYMDQYYFEVNIFSTASNQGLWCFTERLEKLSVDKFRIPGTIIQCNTFDWQLQSAQELDAILERAITQYLLPLQSLPPEKLGAEPEMWKRCICPRDRCAHCWVQKNLWEARDQN